jgi:hypothetical protein
MFGTTTRSGNNFYGGFYAYDKGIAFAIVTQSVYHAFGLRTASDLTAGVLNGWTFDAGRIVSADIASEADTGGKLRIVCAGAHGLVNGDIVTLHGMNNAGHNGTSVVLLDATNPTTEFIANSITYVDNAGASTGSVYAPAYLQCASGAQGNYSINFCLDGTAASSNKNWKWELNKGVTPLDNIVTERNSTNTLASVSATGNATIAAGDRIWLSGKNTSATDDYTVKNMNLNLHRID